MIEKLNNLFDKIYVISFKGSKRLESLPDRLKGLEYEIFYGCDKKDLNLDKLHEEGYGKLWRKDQFTLQQYACAFSHYYLYKKIKEEELKNVLILEDDIVFKPEYLDGMIKDYNDLPDDWDLFYIGLITQRDYNKNYKNMHKGARVKMGNPGLFGFEANAYVINNNFLDIMLSTQDNIETFCPIADAAIWNLYYKMEYYITNNQILPQHKNLER